MMNRLIVAACCALVLVPAAQAAEVYKWKDASGKTVYSDTPPMTHTPYTTLSGKKLLTPQPPKSAGATAEAVVDSSVPPADAAKTGTGDAAKAGTDADKGTADAGKAGAAPAGKAAADPAAEKKAKDAAAKEAAAKEAAKKQQEERQAAEKKAKEQACKNARSRLAQFQQGGRIYRLNEKGEREYFGDKEISVELEQAKADVEENCE